MEDHKGVSSDGLEPRSEATQTDPDAALEGALLTALGEIRDRRDRSQRPQGQQALPPSGSSHSSAQAALVDLRRQGVVGGRMARAKGAGSIQKHGQGFRWAIYIGGKQHKSRTYPSRLEAEQALAQAVGADGKPLGAAARLTVKGWGAMWMRTRTNRNVKVDQRRWALHIAEGSLADMPVAEVGRRTVRTWIAELQRKQSQVQKIGGGRKPSGKVLDHQTVKHCFTLLRTALGDAVEEGLIATNPALGIRLVAPPQTQGNRPSSAWKKSGCS